MWEMGEWKRQKSLLDAQMSDLIDFTHPSIHNIQ